MLVIVSVMEIRHVLVIVDHPRMPVLVDVLAFWHRIVRVLVVPVVVAMRMLVR